MLQNWGKGKMIIYCLPPPPPLRSLKATGPFPGLHPFLPWKTLTQACFPQSSPPRVTFQPPKPLQLPTTRLCPRGKDCQLCPRAAQCLWDHPPKQPPPTWCPRSSVLISWRLEPHPEPSGWGGTIVQRMVGDPTKPSYAAAEPGWFRPPDHVARKSCSQLARASLPLVHLLHQP